MGSIEVAESVSPGPSLIEVLSTSPSSFLQPPPSLHAASLITAKTYLDPLATATSEAQEQRQKFARGKRKRGQPDDVAAKNVLRLKQIYLDGFNVKQISEQTRRVLDAGRIEVERALREFGKENSAAQTDFPPAKTALKKSSRKGNTVVHFQDPENTRFNVDSDIEGDGEVGGSETLQKISQESDSDEDQEETELEAEPAGDVAEDDQFGSYDEVLGESDESEAEPRDVFVPDKNGLNDGFFSIDDFNKRSDFLEQQDARGEDDGAASDEEDIDWDTNPLANGLTNTNDEDEGERLEDEEDGPTFGDADLNGADLSEDDDNGSADDLEMEDPGSMTNTNAIKYADFFEPPPRRLTKAGGRRRALPKTQPPSRGPEIQETDIQRTMAAVRRDIFEDEGSPDDDEPPSDPEDRRSSHQKRQAALTAEIRRLEAAAIQKRDWTLSGEARAADRPLNSLLEEDLEFERVGKPVPVITEEVSEDIEALIKRRILAREFDEVIRRRPGSLATAGNNSERRRGMFELLDTKPEQSLAEVYEAEHLQKTDPAAHPSKADQKLEAEHKKIEALWKEMSAKLDALSSWHYKPKPPSADVNVVADVPTVTMEDARPAGVGGDVGGESMLAPQEIYKAGESRDKAKEITTRGGLPVGREEMTRDEKLRRRRREKERIRKSGQGISAKKGEVNGKKAEDKRNVIHDLKKGGVKVIGKKGELRDVEGNSVQAQRPGKGASGYKL